MNGYIKLHRSIMDWGWYRDGNTARVFLHLLLSANWEPSDFLGQWIGRGQAVFGIKAMAAATGLSVQNIRTALAHLKSTGEITVRPTRNFSIATIEKYCVYQAREDPANIPDDTEDGNEPTTNQQSANIEVTTSKNRRNKEINKYGNRYVSAAGNGSRRLTRAERDAGTDWDVPELKGI
jgi:hypothetical protein